MATTTSTHHATEKAPPERESTPSLRRSEIAGLRARAREVRGRPRAGVLLPRGAAPLRSDDALPLPRADAPLLRVVAGLPPRVAGPPRRVVDPPPRVPRSRRMRSTRPSSNLRSIHPNSTHRRRPLRNRRSRRSFHPRAARSWWTRRRTTRGRHRSEARRDSTRSVLGSCTAWWTTLEHWMELAIEAASHYDRAAVRDEHDIAYDRSHERRSRAVVRRSE